MPTQKPSERMKEITRKLYDRMYPSSDPVVGMVQLVNCRIDAIYEYLDETLDNENNSKRSKKD